MGASAKRERSVSRRPELRLGRDIVAASLAGVAATTMFIAVSANAVLYLVLQRHLEAQWGKGLVVAAYFVPAIAGNRLYAALARYLGPATLAAAAAFVSAIMFACQSPSVASWPLMLATRAVLGLCVGVFVPAVMLVGRQALTARGESAFGVFSLSIPLASLVGPAMGEIVFVRAGPFALFLLLSAFALAAAALLALSRPGSGRVRSTGASPPTAPATYQASRQDMLLLLQGAASFGVATNLVGIFIAPKVIADHLSAAIFFAPAIGTLVAIRLAMLSTRFPKLGPEAVPWLSLGLLVSTGLAFASVPLPFVIAGAVGFGLFQAILFPKLVYLGNRTSTARDRIGNLNFIIAASGLGVALFVGLSADRFGLSMPSLLLCALAAIVTFIRPRSSTSVQPGT